MSDTTTTEGGGAIPLCSRCNDSGWVRHSGSFWALGIHISGGPVMEPCTCQRAPRFSREYIMRGPEGGVPHEVIPYDEMPAYQAAQAARIKKLLVEGY